MKYFIGIIIGVITVMSLSAENLGKYYRERLEQGFSQLSHRDSPSVLEREDAFHLPPPVQKYMENCGVFDRDKIESYAVEMHGRMLSEPNDAGMKVRCEQVNFQHIPARYFKISARRMGIPAGGIHMYEKAEAFMKIKVLGLFKVVDLSGEEMNRAETVTMFNDMCLMAPATLIDGRIEWLEWSTTQARARFTVEDMSIEAELVFNDRNELVNFHSDDRAMRGKDNEMLDVPFSTPVLEYGDVNGYHLATKVETVYHLEDGDFAYGIFEIDDIRYNPHTVK